MVPGDGERADAAGALLADGEGSTRQAGWTVATVDPMAYHWCGEEHTGATHDLYHDPGHAVGDEEQGVSGATRREVLLRSRMVVPWCGEEHNQTPQDSDLTPGL